MTEEERALFIGKKLFKNFHINGEGQVCYELKTHNRDDPYHRWNKIEYYAEWLSSPEGIHAVKQAMIERGYWPSIYYNYELWWCTFYDERGENYSKWQEYGKTEAEAVLAACYKALKGEENNG